MTQELWKLLRQHVPDTKPQHKPSYLLIKTFSVSHKLALSSNSLKPKRYLLANVSGKSEEMYLQTQLNPGVLIQTMQCVPLSFFPFQMAGKWSPEFYIFQFQSERRKEILFPHMYLPNLKVVASIALLVSCACKGEYVLLIFWSSSSQTFGLQEPFVPFELLRIPNSYTHLLYLRLKQNF